jgi:hypothetical protein
MSSIMSHSGIGGKLNIKNMLNDPKNMQSFENGKILLGNSHHIK